MKVREKRIINCKCKQRPIKHYDACPLGFSFDGLTARMSAVPFHLRQFANWISSSSFFLFWHSLLFTLCTAFSVLSFNFTSADFPLCTTARLSPSLQPTSAAFYRHILVYWGLLQPNPPSQGASSWQMTHLGCLFSVLSLSVPLEQYYNAKEFATSLPCFLLLYPLIVSEVGTDGVN